jgi:hypothetical protein
MTMTLIETKTLGAAAASIEFTSSPQDGTDLVVVCSLRGDTNNQSAFTNIGFNSSTSNFSTRFLQADAGLTPGSGTGVRGINYLNNPFQTANTFDSTTVYIPNYTGSTNKSFTGDGVVENNATAAWLFLVAGLWSDTSAITSIQITPNAGNFVTGSTISLYKVTKGSDGIVTTS